jgi:hypothetical protein
MSNQHTAYITAVEPKHITRANGQAFDLWQVFDSDGSIWVVKPPLAKFAQMLVGQQATFTTRSETKVTDAGEFVNYYADAIYPVEGSQMLGQQQGYQPQPQQQPQAQPTQPQPQAQPQDNPAEQQASQRAEAEAREQQKRLEMNRALATKVAAWVCQGDQYTFWTLIPDLLRFYETGWRPDNIIRAEQIARQSVGNQPQTNSTPQANAEGAGMPEYTNPSVVSGGGMLTADEDIPFHHTV